MQVGEPLRSLRRLLYCGEWIESHVLHVFFLHAPDFLGYEDAIQMAGDHPEIVERALQLKKVGNDIVALLGGREIHPVNVRVGGFYHVPARRAWAPLVERLKWARDVAVEAVRWAASLPFPDFEQDYEFVALRHPAEYPFNEGRLVSNKGLDIGVREFEDFFIEEHVAHSTALHATVRGRSNYLVGPLARYSLNFDRLSPLAQEAAREAGLRACAATRSRASSSVAWKRSMRWTRRCEFWTGMRCPRVRLCPPRRCAGVGCGCTEAPRGILYHRYLLDEQGIVREAKIVPPTAQNQKTIESDLRQYVTTHSNLPLNELTWQCEQSIRNYDPCISCSTHFLGCRWRKWGVNQAHP